MQIKLLFGKIQCKLNQQLPHTWHSWVQYAQTSFVLTDLTLTISYCRVKAFTWYVAQSSRYSSRSRHVVKTHEHPYNMRNHHLISKCSQDQQPQEGTKHLEVSVVLTFVPLINKMLQLGLRQWLSLCDFNIKLGRPCCLTSFCSCGCSLIDKLHFGVHLLPIAQGNPRKGTWTACTIRSISN